MNESAVNANEKELWNASIVNHDGSFLQSWEWGEFQKELGRKICRLSSRGNSVHNLWIKYPLPLGKCYVYCPRPTQDTLSCLPDLIPELKTIALQEKAVFLKIEPDLVEEESGKFSLDQSGFIKSFKQVQPQNTLILDLTKIEEELLKEMKSKTRYNIKLARHKDLKIIINESSADKEKNFDGFWELMRQTSQRNNFHLHPKDYYYAQSALPFIKLFLIEYQQKIIAGAAIVFFGRRATYLHGASSDDYKNLMAPYLLHWEIIKYSQKNGFKEYDFWGISAKLDEKDWGGITRFKKGFGGKEVHYIGAYDWVFSKPWYGIYRLGRKILNK